MNDAMKKYIFLAVLTTTSLTATTADLFSHREAQYQFGGMPIYKSDRGQRTAQLRFLFHAEKQPFYRKRELLEIERHTI